MYKEISHIEEDISKKILYTRVNICDMEKYLKEKLEVNGCKFSGFNFIAMDENNSLDYCVVFSYHDKYNNMVYDVTLYYLIDRMRNIFITELSVDFTY